ncbi:MAG: SDR family NAD(P)-dependent oxidoreductase [Gammaproteobacteria bacterium]|nr:SDR family NAD(P)-dependent oxidoreductase [Gammaproteobacteria bacterium]
MGSKVAFITGASRGIGKASAIALAQQGFDVVVTARTLEEGEAYEHGSRDSDVKPMPGSLRATAAEIEKPGRRAADTPSDLLDLASIDAAVERVYAEWGRIDLLVNNGIYQAGHHVAGGRTDPSAPARNLPRQRVRQRAHDPARAAAHARAGGGLHHQRGVVESGMTDPPAAAGKGGWGFAYGASKAALIRMAGVLAGGICRHAAQFLQHGTRAGCDRGGERTCAPDREDFTITAALR